jgi:hypothetical protein
MSDTPSPAAAEDTQRVEQLSRCFATLDKVVRGMRLYEGKGALIERLMADLELKLSTMLEQGEVTVRVTPIGLVYGTTPLTAAGEKTPRYLFRLFCDGVRELTFLPGVERSEIVDLVAVLNMEAQGEDEDLVTLLWKKQMRHIQYFAADTLDMTTQVSADGELSLAYEASVSRLRQSGAGAGGQEVHLSADDLRVLRQDERLAWVKDCTAPTRAEGALAEAATRIKQAFVSPKDYPRFLAVALRHSADGAEASPLVLNMIDAQLRQGDLDTVAPVLEAIIEAAEEGSDPAQALKKRLCDADRMALIAPVYADNTERLAPILQSLAKADNQAIVTLLEHLDSPEAKAALQDVLNQAEVDLTPFYEGHLRSEDEKQIVAGIEALGRIGTPPAIKAVATSLGHTLSSVRHAALLALHERYQPESRMAIGRVLKDPSPDNRMLAIDLLASSGDSRVAWLLLSAIQEPAFLQKGSSEQEALFTALASFKDARTLDFFKGVLQSGGLLKNKALVERQLQAARALAQMSTPEATTALQDCRGKWGLAKPVKAEINRLLAGARP